MACLNDYTSVTVNKCYACDGINYNKEKVNLENKPITKKPCKSRMKSIVKKAADFNQYEHDIYNGWHLNTWNVEELNLV
jgi:hypothetical protein